MMMSIIYGVKRGGTGGARSAGSAGLGRAERVAGQSERRKDGFGAKRDRSDANRFLGLMRCRAGETFATHGLTFCGAKLCGRAAG